MSIDDVVHRGVEVPLLRDVVETQHRELADLEDLVRLPGVEQVLGSTRLNIYIALVYNEMLQ